MDLLTGIKERHSVRAYLDKPVDQGKLDQLLDAARLAPSARNLQDWHFVVVRDPKVRQKVADHTGQAFVHSAPIIIAGVSTDPNRIMSCGVPAYPVNLAIALTNITLAATALDLGTCFIGKFDQDKVKETLGIPAEYKVVQMLTLGYPADKEKPKNRKELSEIVSYDKFQS